MVNNQVISNAAKVIQKGGVVAFPTETVYGLGADAFNPMAVARIFEIKERPAFDPLIVHIAEADGLGLLAEIENKELVDKLIEKFWPGPLTIVLPKKSSVPDIVTSGLSTVAVRMPDHLVALELIRESGTPIAAPSANKFGMLSPTLASHVGKQLPHVDFIIDGGKTTVGIESTVITLSGNGFKLLRPGVITVADLEEVLPEIHNMRENRLQSPGQLKSHYSPRIPVYIQGESAIKGDLGNAGYLALSPLQNTGEYQLSLSLSTGNDLREAAVNLFSALHQLEESGVKFIVVEPVPETGIGMAIMDRLRKAAYQYK
ncbi:MAG: threonylcarbamoyl-AMP synthase [Prolixibacteraceae bacterium]|nr:threonylcarbamoyl-AMP synthase [Prolixibacteraceae bacterium]